MVPHRVVKDDGTPEEGARHLDKKVPIALIGSLVLQSMALVWWASKMDSRVEQLERSDTRTELLISQRMKLADERHEGLARDRDRVVRVEEQIKSMLDILRRLEMRLERVVVPPKTDPR